ncbi:YybH family protein [Adhaeribacter terreus]|uniref:YybH family protein n=1 Tax=Adhaeribacter terreus TaxID=529703 RepID=A0ABW0EA96_9BACT
MKNFTSQLLLGLAVAFASACTSTSRLAGPQNTGDTREAVMQADRDFSKMSEEKGLNTAFIAYAADDAVLLRAKTQPITGRENIRMYMSRTSDDGIRLTWSPQYADIAASGDMAYTYGTYLMETRDIDGKVITTDGTYVSIWKKDAKGFWKYVLDSGNQGLRP